MSDTLPTADQPPPRSLVDEVAAGQAPAAALELRDAGPLMAHQRAWIEDRSPLKIVEKGRRTGITWAEAHDATLIAAASREAGGDNYWYIGDTKEKGREFVRTVAEFARPLARELLEVEEFLFEDARDDGTSKFIQAYRVRFASGFQVAALSSNPASIRGLQGVVLIDEAAFHRDVHAVIDACVALLIWGGRVRLVSTHNGATNPFAELIREVRAGKRAFSLHRVTFDDAVANGLYERMCLRTGETPTVDGKAAWYARVRGGYGGNVEAMREELDAIPREGEGVLLPLAWIEAAMREAHVVRRWAPPAEDFVDWPEAARRAEMQGWLEREVLPVIQALRPEWGPFHLGGDFAMRQDRSAFAFGHTAQDLRRVANLIVELRHCPYDQQKQALFWVLRRLPRFAGGILDANGNGMVLAQEARQAFGEKIVELMPNDAWFREHSPRFRSAFEERVIELPADRDVRDDLRQLRLIGGVGKVPRDVRTEGTDGGKRHADAAVALVNFHAATLAGAVEIDFRAGGRRPMGFEVAGGPVTEGGVGAVRGGLDLVGWDR